MLVYLLQVRGTSPWQRERTGDLCPAIFCARPSAAHEFAVSPPCSLDGSSAISRLRLPRIHLWRGNVLAPALGHVLLVMVTYGSTWLSYDDLLFGQTSVSVLLGRCFLEEVNI